VKFIIKFLVAFFVLKLFFIKFILSSRYDKEESNTIFDVNSSSLFLGDETSLQKEEAELARKKKSYVVIV
jgi:hypothetical protein